MGMRISGEQPKMCATVKGRYSYHAMSPRPVRSIRSSMIANRLGETSSFTLKRAVREELPLVRLVHVSTKEMIVRLSMRAC